MIQYHFNLLASPPEEQKHIVALIEREQSLVNANKELTYNFEQNPKDFPAAPSFGIQLATPKGVLEFLGDLP